MWKGALNIVKKKIISFAIVALMLFAPTVTDTTVQAAHIHKPQFQITTQNQSYDSKLSGKIIKLSPKEKSKTNQVSKKAVIKYNKPANLRKIQISNKAKVGFNNIANSLLKGENSNSNYKLFTKNGVISKEGDIFPIYPITLSEGQALQAQLKMPENSSLEYDLYLYKFGTDGKLISTPVDESLYNGDVLPDSVGTVNKGQSSLSYAIIVSSRKGASSTDQFTVDIALSNDPDAFESNQNAITATQFPDIAAGKEYTSPALTLNTPYDDDWFVLNVKNVDDFSNLNIVAINPNSKSSDTANVELDMYTVTDISNGITMQKSSSNNNDFQIYKGTNYLRIHSENNDFSPASYVLKVKPNYKASKVILTPYSDGELCSTVTYEAGELYYIKSGGIFGMKAQLLSKNNYCIKGAEITVSWHDPAWGPNSLPECRNGSNSGITGSDGIAMVKNKMPPSYGQYHERGYPSYVIHNVDVIDVNISCSDVYAYTNLGHSNFYLSS